MGNFAKDLTITDSPRFDLDSLNLTRDGTIQDIAGVRNRSFTTTWSHFTDALTHNPRAYIFWTRLALENNTDTALLLSLDCGSVDFDTKPISDNTTQEGQANNRRVEFVKL